MTADTVTCSNIRHTRTHTDGLPRPPRASKTPRYMSLAAEASGPGTWAFGISFYLLGDPGALLNNNGGTATPSILVAAAPPRSTTLANPANSPLWYSQRWLSYLSAAPIREAAQAAIFRPEHVPALIAAKMFAAGRKIASCAAILGRKGLLNPRGVEHCNAARRRSRFHQTPAPPPPLHQWPGPGHESHLPSNGIAREEATTSCYLSISHCGK